MLNVFKLNCLDKPVGIYMFKVNNGNTKTVCEICSIINFEQISYWSGVVIVDFEQANTGSVI